MAALFLTWGTALAVACPSWIIEAFTPLLAIYGAPVVTKALCTALGAVPQALDYVQFAVRASISVVWAWVRPLGGIHMRSKVLKYIRIDIGHQSSSSSVQVWHTCAAHTCKTCRTGLAAVSTAATLLLDIGRKCVAQLLPRDAPVKLVRATPRKLHRKPKPARTPRKAPEVRGLRRTGLCRACPAALPTSLPL